MLCVYGPRGNICTEDRTRIIELEAQGAIHYTIQTCV
jgi:hypothetical protein